MSMIQQRWMQHALFAVRPQQVKTAEESTMV